MTAATRELGSLVSYDIVTTSILLLLSFTVLSVSNREVDRQADDSEVTPILVAQTTPRRALVLSILSLGAFTYLADAAVNILRAVLVGTWTKPGPIGLVSYLSGFLAFGLLAVFLSWKDTKGVEAWSRKRVRFFAALAVMFTIGHIIVVATTGHLRARHPPITIPEKPSPPDALYSPFVHFAIAVLRLLILLPLFPTLANPYISFVPPTPLAAHEAAEEGTASPGSISITNPASVSYLASSGLSAPKAQYGTFTPRNGLGQPSQQTSRAPTPTGEDSAAPKKPASATKTPDVNLDPTWKELGARLKRILPYLWPRGSVRLEGLALFCFVLLIAGRFITFYVPTTLRKLVSMFDSVQTVPAPSPWRLLFIYAALRFLQGAGGLNALRDIAWAPVMQFSDRKMSQMAFDHLLNLSLAFHTKRKTGEILRILDRGQAINHIFELILFNIFPTIIDIIVALTVFVIWFSWTLSAVVFLVMFTYVVSSIALTSWRTKIRRQMNDRDVITRGIHTDCLLNYETVKYFGGEQHEAERYRQAIEGYQELEFKVMASLNLLNLVQNFIISFGLLVGSILVTVEVVNGTKQTSDFIFFITYLGQVYGPLNNLGYIYRSINQSLVDTERLFKLLDESKDVNDKPGAEDLVVTDGEIEFRNVSFTYDDRTSALRNVSFKVPKGKSVALVGESGSGKSTILRLLYRFYDLQDHQGQILIDGQDIRDVTQASLRRAIGVVPQDSVLFNHTIAYNIGYGKFGASQSELEIAASAAQMHDRILTFPDGYNTKVGERGVRLSGGEKQRVSIARTFLKNAPILLLDEATSALDTTTEKDIQKALQNLLTGRSSLSIAHRLSTIANSDIILVLKDGEIVETGSHKDLVAANGVFAAMWAVQITTENDHLLIDIPTEEPKTASGFTIPTTPGAMAVMDFTENPVGREAIIPTSEQPNPIIGPGPVIPPASFDDLKVESKDELEARAANLNELNDVPAPSQEVPTEDVADSSVPPPIISQDGPSYAAVVAKPEEPQPALDAPDKAVVETDASPMESTPAPADVDLPPSPVEPETAPVAFPSSDGDNSTHTTPAAADPKPESTPMKRGHTSDSASVNTPAGVTFSTASAPPRPSTPDGKKQGKIQRIARRISLGGRRSSFQAAEAASAVAAAANPPRSDSPTPRESLSSRLGLGRSSNAASKEDVSNKAVDDSPIPAAESSTPSVVSTAGVSTGKKKNNKKKAKK